MRGEQWCSERKLIEIEETTLPMRSNEDKDQVEISSLRRLKVWSCGGWKLFGDEERIYERQSIGVNWETGRVYVNGD
jgi:hypothetical protein